MLLYKVSTNKTTITLGFDIVWVDALIVHVQNECVRIACEVSLVTVALRRVGVVQKSALSYEPDARPSRQSSPARCVPAGAAPSTRVLCRRKHRSHRPHWRNSDEIRRRG